MPVPTPAASWTGSLWWLIGLSVAAFTVSWLLANRLRLGRAPYVGALFVITGALSAGYVAWLGLGAGEVVTARWGWGLLAAPVFAAFPAFGMTRLPASNRRTGRALGAALAWEGVVYGVTEGILLSALPTFMTWQLVHSLGWGGAGGGLARWTLPVAASIVVIVVHHLGYAEYRNKQLVPISVGCRPSGGFRCQRRDRGRLAATRQARPRVPAPTVLGLPEPLSRRIGQRSQRARLPLPEGRSVGSIWAVLAFSGLASQQYLRACGCREPCHSH